MSKATDAELSALHGAIARGLTEVVTAGVVAAVKEDGEEVRTAAPAAYFMAAITLLKNNNITADAEQNSDLAELNRALAERRANAKRKFTARDIEEAASALERDLGGMPQ